MLFHTLQFAVFFCCVFALYVVLPHKWQNRLLLVGSYVFYGAWDWRYISLLMISTVVDYCCGIGIDRTEKDDVRRRKMFVAVSVIANLSMLCTFKYFDFFAASFQELMGHFGLVVHPYFLNVALPIGISFYTFQTMSYTIDVYRGKVPSTRNFWDFALYVSYFPQLIAGPIERGQRLLPQILKPRVLTLKKALEGAYIFLWGLFLKVVIADNLAKIIDPIFLHFTEQDGGMVLLGVYAFAIQIFCDFAGYSFMAIGMAHAMGISLMENFKRPYFSKNISEFWRRWHISLSSWFRDYVFSPFYIFCEKRRWLSGLSMKRRHAVAFFVALLSVEYLLGLWHGAGWNFGLFGIYHGLMIWAYYYLRHTWDKMPTLLQIVLTFHIACGGWLIFRSPTLGQAVDMFHAMVTNFQFGMAHLEIALSIVAITSVLLVIQVFEHRKDDTLVVLRWREPYRSGIVILLFCLILIFGEFGKRPFIYFQF